MNNRKGRKCRSVFFFFLPQLISSTKIVAAACEPSAGWSKQTKDIDCLVIARIKGGGRRVLYNSFDSTHRRFMSCLCAEASNSSRARFAPLCSGLKATSL